MATAAPGASRYTGTNPFLDGLIWGDKWNQSSGPITWAMGRAKGQDPVTARETAAFDTALQAWGSVANLKFNRISTPSAANLEFFAGGSQYFIELGIDTIFDGPSLAMQNGPNNH